MHTTLNVSPERENKSLLHGLDSVECLQVSKRIRHLRMESLFETNYVNTQRLRKYEPLIRYDIDGNPQPRRQLDGDLKIEDSHKNPTPVSAPSSVPAVSATPAPSKHAAIPKPAPTNSKPSEDLKRKASDPPPVGSEPTRKKQQTQTKIMSFFKKC